MRWRSGFPAAIPGKAHDPHRGWKTTSTTSLILVDARCSILSSRNPLAESGTDVHRDIIGWPYQNASDIVLVTPKLLANINSIPRNLGESSSNRIPMARVLWPLK